MANDLTILPLMPSRRRDALPRPPTRRRFDFDAALLALFLAAQAVVVVLGVASVADEPPAQVVAVVAAHVHTTP